VRTAACLQDKQPLSYEARIVRLQALVRRKQAMARMKAKKKATAQIQTFILVRSKLAHRLTVARQSLAEQRGLDYDPLPPGSAGAGRQQGEVGRSSDLTSQVRNRVENLHAKDIAMQIEAKKQVVADSDGPSAAEPDCWLAAATSEKTYGQGSIKWRPFLRTLAKSQGSRVSAWIEVQRPPNTLRLRSFLRQLARVAVRVTLAGSTTAIYSLQTLRPKRRRPERSLHLRTAGKN
jgi:hypothetical protein